MNQAQHDDESIRNLWVAAGGTFHGPDIERGTALMNEADVIAFIRSLLVKQEQVA